MLAAFPYRSVVGFCLLFACAAVALGLSASSAASQDTEDSEEAAEQQRSSGSSKSYGLYVGRELTRSGDTLLAGSGEEVSSHWLEIVPREEHDPDETIEVGGTEDASIPGELIEIPQVEETNKYITMNYSDYEGFPAPLTNGGLNDQGVAIRDIWSPSREELVEMTPTPQSGPQYSDLARIALERAGSAREAVEIIGELIDEHGYSTYGGNSHMIADEDEGWVMIQTAGGEGIWAAERLGPDEVRVSYPGYIGEMPEDYGDSEDFMGSENLFSFAEEQGWHEDGDTFSFHEVYGDRSLELRTGGAKFVSQADLEGELEELAPEVSVKNMMDMIGDERFVDDESGYGQVVRLRDDLPHPDLATLWVSPTGSITAPFIPGRFRRSTESTATSPKTPPRPSSTRTTSPRRRRSSPGEPSNASCTTPANTTRNSSPK